MLPRRAFRLPPLRMTIRSPPPSLLWATTLRLRSGQALGRPYKVFSNGNCLPSSQARTGAKERRWMGQGPCSARARRWSRVQ